MGEVIQLNRESATALLTEARREFENAAHETWTSDDESQRPTLDASVEVIGRLNWTVERAWPQEQSPIGPLDQALVEFEFTPETLTWFERQRASQEGYIVDLDAGTNEAPEPGYIAEQVYLLHVLNGITKQREAVAV